MSLFQDTAIISYGEEYFDSYAKLAQKYFGENCFQSHKEYIDWLYQKNPSLHKDKYDFLLALDKNQEVVGFDNKMRLTWRFNDELISIPTGHNLLVEENNRNGTGIKLIYSSIKKEKIVLIIGVSPPLSSLYDKLGQKLSTCWYRKIISPIRGSVKKIMRIINISKETNIEINKDIEDTMKGNYRLSFRPDNFLINRIIRTLNNKSDVIAFPYWSFEQFYWRFFHPQGPKHFLLYRKSDRELLQDFLIISIGIRKDVNIARIVEMSASSSSTLREMLSCAEKSLKKMGIHILSIFCGDKKLNEMYQKCGWVPMKNAPYSYFVHANRKDRIQSYSFHGSAGDFGFEAVLTEIRGGT